MPPHRTKDAAKNAEASSSKGDKPQTKKYHHQPKATPIPGKQKLKSSLRQAKRLLAKENLAADKRVEAERRVKALEAELEQADQSQKERAMAVRYHKVKFFERQKVMRKLKKLKKQLDSNDEKNHTQVAAQLLEERVNLNYILHYPKTKKYISLFPPEVRQAISAGASEKEANKTDKGREEVRAWVRTCMDEGKLSSEPEVELESGARAKTSQFPADAHSAATIAAQPADATGDIEQDDFFDNDSEDESD